MLKIGDPCIDCGELLTDYNGMPVCAPCYEKAFQQVEDEQMLTPEEIHERYFYHKPTPRAAELHDKVNNMLEQVALTLEEILPEGRQKALSHTALEEVRFRANASIAQNHDKL